MGVVCPRRSRAGIEISAERSPPCEQSAFGTTSALGVFVGNGAGVHQGVGVVVQGKRYQVFSIKEILEKEHFDYFIFGHRHLPIDLQLNDTSRYINLGDWINYDSYAVFENDNLSLKYYKQNEE